MNTKNKVLNNLAPSPESQSMVTAIEGIRRMFVDKVQHDHIVDEKQTPAKRAAFIKQHGSVHGVFQVDDNLSKQYQVGIFQPGARYEAWVRYSSDVPDERPDKNSTVGIGIKLFGISGEKELEEDRNATTLDFILQNTEVFFAADAMEMCEFKTAAINGTLDRFLEEHPETAKILDEMGKRTVESVLTEPLWSCVPYKFGEDNYCKFKLMHEVVAEPDSPPDFDAPIYLARDLQERLNNGGARLNFYVQLRNDPETQSIISARSLWDEQQAVPVKVATLILPQQSILARGQGPYGETLAYNIWRTLPEMAPVGSIAEARKVVYRSSAQTRRNVNGQIIGEPTEPRTPGAPVPPYQPSFESPWPPAKEDVQEGDIITVDFNGLSDVTIPPKQYYELTHFSVSTRDTEQMTSFTQARSTIPGIIDEVVIRVVNNDRLTESLRLVFNEKVKYVQLGLSVIARGDDGSVKVTALDENDNPISSVTTVSQGACKVTASPYFGQDIKTIEIKFSESVTEFDVGNVRFSLKS